MNVRWSCLAMVLTCATLRAAAPTTRAVTKVDLDSPTRISLKLENATLEQAVKALSDAAKTPEALRFQQMGRRSTTPINLDLKNEPMLLAMHKLAETSGALVRWPWMNEPIIILHGSPTTRPRAGAGAGAGAGAAADERSVTRPGFLHGPLFHHGPFTAVASATTLSRTRDVRKAADEPSSQNLTVHVVLYVEPKVALLGYAPHLAVKTATDETGASLVPQEFFSNAWFSQRMRMISFNCSLDARKLRGRSIARLEATGKVRVVSAYETIDLPLEGTHSITLAKFPVTISPMRAKNGTLQPSIAIDGRAASQDDWKRFAELLACSRVRLLNAEGRGVTVGWPNRPIDLDRQVTISIGAANPMQAKELANVQPSRMQWEVPTEALDVEIPLEFRDLPLP